MLLCQGDFLEMTSLISSKGNNMMRLKQENQSSIRKIILSAGTGTALFYCRRPASDASYYYNKCECYASERYFIFEDRDNVVMTPGRSALPVDIVPDSRYFIGVEITQISRSVCICNYRGASSLPVLIIPYIRNIAKYCNPQPVWCRLHSVHRGSHESDLR